LADRTLDLFGGSMSRAFGSKAVARIREGRIEQRGKDLEDGLLDQAIQNVRDVGGILHLLQLALGIMDKKSSGTECDLIHAPTFRVLVFSVD
jgi:hypothetical protein